MDTFHFMRPWWLLSLAILLLALPWLWHLFKQQSGWQRVLAPHLSQALLKSSDKGQSKVWFGVVASAWVITSIALAGPSWERLPTPVYQSERNAVIIIDMSLNTRATDISPDRLTRLRFKALDLLEELTNTQVGLVAYAGDAYSISPLTRDHENMRAMIPALSPEIMPVVGNYPLLAFQEAHRMIVDAGYENAELYWLSAGMRLDDYQEISRFLRGKGHRLSTLVAGEEESSPIRLATGDMLRDNLGRLSMARLNARLFERISDEYHGRYARLRADDADIKHLTAQGPWQQGVVEDAESERTDQWLDFGPYLAWLLLPLAIFAMRRGVIISLLAVMTPALLITPNNAYANTDSMFNRSFQNQQQRALTLYQQGDYQRAADLFQDPLMQGNAYYRAGNYGNALDAYAQAPDSAERSFNSGNALAQLGELEAASDAFARALELRPDWREAQDNKQLVDELLERQQEDAPQPEQNGSDDSQEPAKQDEHQPSDDEHSDTTQEPEAQSQPGEPEDEQANDEETGSEAHAEPGELEQEEIEQETAALEAALQDDELTDEERTELEQLLRRVQNDPATLLRNRMRLEAERRQQTQPPRGVRRP